MLHTIIGVIIIALALLVLYKAARSLIGSGWFSGWLRGTLGLLWMALAVVMALVALDFLSYRQAANEEFVATIEFEKISDQTYNAILTNHRGEQQKFVLRGDQWQIDARVMKLKKPIGAFGLAPAYRLERIGGRYFDLKQELSTERTVFQLESPHYGLDFWSWLNRHPQWMPFIDATYGNATYLPFADKARFNVYLSATGLLARPVNTEAEAAVNAWQ